MKKPRPAALPSITIQMQTRCGKIYVTVTVDSHGLPFETFVRFGKAGHCGAAIFDATTKLISYALRSGMDPQEAIKALGGIGCYCGTDSCMNAVSLVLREVLEHPECCIPALGYNRQTHKRGRPPPRCNRQGRTPCRFPLPSLRGCPPQRPPKPEYGPKQPDGEPFGPLSRPQHVSVLPPPLSPALQLRRSPENRLP